VTIDPAEIPNHADLTLPASGRGTSSVWHLLTRSAWLIALLVPSVVLHFVWRLRGQRSPWPGWFLGRAARACGACVEPSGTPLRHDVIFVANHISWIDILLIGGEVDVRFISQDKVRHWPVIGWLAVLNATIFVSRTDRAGVADQIARVRAAIAGDRPLAIFPEGTTTDGRSLLPFKPALFAALEPPPRAMMVQPVVLEFDAAGSALAWIGTEHGATNAFRVLRRPGKFVVGLRFLEAFDAAAVGDRKAVASEARRRISAALSARYGHAIA
jgi:1-acyl-sn-glycerol-3-phosphate acyltransferase